MFDTIQFFLNQWPAMWMLLSACFFALGLWWAYETWCRHYRARLEAARQEHQRLRNELARLSVKSSATDSHGNYGPRLAAATAGTTVIAGGLRPASAPKSTGSTKQSDAVVRPGFRLNVPESRGEKVDWLKVPGVNQRLVHEFEALGIDNFDQLERMSHDDRRSLESHLASRGISWDWMWMQNWKGFGLPRTPPELSTGTVGGVATVGAMGLAANALTGNTSKESANGKGVDTLRNRITLPKATGAKVDWSEVPGVDRRLADEFEELGVEELKQLERMTPIDRKNLEAHLASRGISWDWTWMQNWKTLETETSANRSLALPGNVTSDNLSAESASAAVVEWSSVQGVQPELADELNALGVENFEQLESLTLDERDKLKARLAARGVKWDWGQLGNWKGLAGLGAAAGAEAGGVAASERTSESGAVPMPTVRWPVPKGPRVDWLAVPGIDSRVGAELQSLGVTNVQQLEALKPEERTKLDNYFAKKGLTLDWMDLRSWQPKIDASLPINFPPSSGEAVNWSSIDGIDHRLASEFRSLGVTEIEQIEALPYDERRKLETRLRAKGLTWDWFWLPRWKTQIGGVGRLKLPEAKGPKTDWNTVPGVNPKVAAEFDHLRIHNLDQLRALSIGDRAKLESQLASKGLQWHWGWLFPTSEVRSFQEQPDRDIFKS